MRRFLHQYALTILYLVIVAVLVIFFFGKLSTTHQQQIAACERGNDLRYVLSVNEDILLSFLTEARDARVAAATQFRLDGDLKQAKINQDLADSYTSKIERLKPVNQVDCQATVK